MICLSLSADSLSGMAAQLRRYAGSCNLVELRLDLLQNSERDALLGARPSASVLREAVDGESLDIILTFRRSSDGGAWQGSEDDRLRMLAAALDAVNGTYIDLEDDIVGREDEHELRLRAADHGVRIIRSRHDFSRTPKEPYELLQHLSECGGPNEIPKLAVHVDGTTDLLRLIKGGMEFRAAGANEMIVVGMGAYGFATRAAACRLGSLLSYCSDHEVGVVAPGQIDPETMHRIYRPHQQNTDTAVFGIIGNPVMHSRSPEYHNAEFSRQGRNAVYLPFQTDDLGAFRELMELLDIRGLSVTIPHKEGVRSWFVAGDKSSAGTATVGEEVHALGACNTVLRDGSGLMRAANTDVDGFMQPLQQRMPSIKGAGVTLIGAGGAARAILYGLLTAGAHVLILNRNVTRAEALAAEFASLGKLRAAPLSAESAELVVSHRDVIVQSSSVGMHPQTDSDPLLFYSFRGDELVYDIIYTPPQTRILARAKAAGCTTISGIEMFEAQAARQAALFLTV